MILEVHNTIFSYAINFAEGNYSLVADLSSEMSVTETGI